MTTERLSTCPLCGESHIRPDSFATWQLNLAQDHAVTQCARCGLRFLNPRPNPMAYEQMYRDGSGPLSETYPPSEDYYAHEDDVRLGEYRTKLDMLIDAGAQGRLLEIGACTGVFLSEARRYGFEVEGIEPSEENRRRALENHHLRLRPGVAEGQDFADASFDVVFSSHVFEHLTDPAAVTRQAFRWLRPGGFLMIEVPNQFDSFASRRHRWLKTTRRKERSFLCVHHTVFFSRSTLTTLVRRAGFVPQRLRNIYYSSDSLWRHPLQAAGRLIGAAAGGSAVIEVLAHKPVDPYAMARNATG